MVHSEPENRTLGLNNSFENSLWNNIWIGGFGNWTFFNSNFKFY